MRHANTSRALYGGDPLSSLPFFQRGFFGTTQKHAPQCTSNGWTWESKKRQSPGESGCDGGASRSILTTSSPRNTPRGVRQEFLVQNLGTLPLGFSVVGTNVSRQFPATPSPVVSTGNEHTDIVLSLSSVNRERNAAKSPSGVQTLHHASKFLLYLLEGGFGNRLETVWKSPYILPCEKRMWGCHSMAMSLQL